MVAAHQRDRDADEAVAAREVERHAVLDAHQLVRRHEAGERPGDRHGEDDLPGGRDAAVDRRRLAAAGHPQLVPGPALPDVEPDQDAADEGERQRGVERRLAEVDAKRGERRAQGGHPDGRRVAGALRDLRAGDDQDVDQQVGHDRGGDEVQHDRRDDDVAAAPGLEPARDEAPDGAERGRGQDGERQRHGCREVAGGERHEREAETPDIGLPLAADVEQAGVIGHGDGEAGVDEVGRVVERVADRLAVAERAVDEELGGLERILADQEDDQPGDEEGEQEVEEGEQDVLGPARQLAAARHQAASLSVIPAISSPTLRSSASVWASSPVRWPSNMTRMRSQSERISSSSTETTSTALPASRMATRRLWMNSMAPMSTPRVGWPTSSRSGSCSSSRAMTSFRWLPPEKEVASSCGSRGRTS